MSAREDVKSATLTAKVVLPFAAGYFLSYLFRTVNAVLAPEIAGSIPLDAADIGLMTGIYFIAFAAAQLPIGIMLDRFGPRRVEAALLSVAAAGALAFALADNAAALVVGRALVGLGVASCLMAPIKANVLFFPARRLPLMNGVILGAGGLGAVAATHPVHLALAFTDWRGVYGGVAALTLTAAAVIWRVVPDPAAAAPSRLGQQIKDLGEIFRTAIFWRIAPATMVSLGSFMAVQGLWAGPWLRDVAGQDEAGTAAGLAAMAAGMAVGYVSAGALADRLERMGVATVTLGAFGMTAHAVTLAAMAAGWAASPLVLAGLYGVTGATSSVNYAVLTRCFPPRLAGRVNTSLNLLIFVAAFALQWGLGWVLGCWDKIGGHWPAEAWAAALGLPLVLSVAALAWLAPACGKAMAGKPA